MPFFPLQAKVLYSFDGEEANNEISIFEGEILTIVNPVLKLATTLSDFCSCGFRIASSREFAELCFKNAYALVF